MKQGEKVSMAGAVLAAALLLAGCSKEPADPETGPVKIELSATVPGGVRAPGSGGDASTKALVIGEEPIHLYFAAGTADESGTFVQRDGPFLGLRDAGDGARMLHFTPDQYYPEDGGELQIFGWYPMPDEISDDGQLRWNVDGQRDILVAYRHTGSAASPLRTITFQHQLTQLQLYAFGEPGAAARWGDITGVELHSAYTQYRFRLSQNGGGFSGSPTRLSPGGFTQAAIPEGADPSVAVRLGEPLLAIPIGTDQRYAVSFYTQRGGEVLVMLPARDYVAGQAAKVIVYFTSDKAVVKPVIEIEDWTTGPSLSNTYPMLDGRVLLTGGLFGSVPGLPGYHEPWTDTPLSTEPYDAQPDGMSNTSGTNLVSPKFRLSRGLLSVKDETGGVDWQKNVYKLMGIYHETYNPQSESACASYSENGVTGQWRLPTLAEAALIKALPENPYFNYDKGNGFVTACLSTPEPGLEAYMHIWIIPSWNVTVLPQTIDWEDGSDANLRAFCVMDVP